MSTGIILHKSLIIENESPVYKTKEFSFDRYMDNKFDKVMSTLTLCSTHLDSYKKNLLKKEIQGAVAPI